MKGAGENARVFWILMALVSTAFGGCDAISRRTLHLWQFWDVSIIRPMLDRFESEHPGVRVKARQLNWKDGLEEIQAALVSGREPDVCELGSSWLARFADDGVLADLTAVYEAQSDSFLLWDSAFWKGRVWGLPWVHAPRALFYNRGLFRRAGLDPDPPPATWEQLLRAAAIIDSLDADIDGFGQNHGERFVPYKNFLALAWGNGGRILDDNGAIIFNDARTLEALEFYRSLSGYSRMGTQEALDRRFMEGRLGMQISGAWNLKRFRELAPDLDFGVALVPKPAVDRGEHVSFSGSQLLVVFRDSGDTTESIELARFLHRYPMSRRLALADGSVFPASIQVYGDTAFTGDVRVRTFLEQALTSRPAPVHPAWIDMEDIVNSAVEEVLEGRRAPRWCLRSAAEEMAELAARFDQLRSDPGFRADDRSAR